MGENREAVSPRREHPPDPDSEKSNCRAVPGATLDDSSAVETEPQTGPFTEEYTAIDSTTTVVLRPVGIGSRGPLYEVEYHGEVIVKRSIDPEHDAARALAARGLSGPFVTVDSATGRQRMMFKSITATARFTISEESRTGLRMRKWVSAAEVVAKFGRAAESGAQDRPPRTNAKLPAPSHRQEAIPPPPVIARYAR